MLPLFFTFTFYISHVFSQGTWTQKASLPAAGRGYGIGFTIGNYGYAGLGVDYSSSTFYNDFWQYNPSTNAWIRKANFPGNARVCPATFVVGNKAYVVTGFNNTNTSISECWQYDAGTDTWTQLNDFPGGARCCAVGFTIGTGYIGLGGQSQFYILYRDLWKYDTLTDTWAREADFPATGRWGASAFTVFGKGYVCSGSDTTANFINNDLWAYDTVTNIWVQKSSCPDSVYAANGFAIGNNIYVGTGFNGDYYHTFWKYNSITDAWTSEPNYIGGGEAFCSAFAIGDSGYMGLGIDSQINPYNDWYKFFDDTIATGLQNISSTANDISVYPNPFSSICNVSILYSIMVQSPRFALYNILGNEVNVGMEKSNGGIIISKGNLQDGIYFLSIYYNNRNIIKKIVLMN